MYSFMKCLSNSWEENIGSSRSTFCRNLKWPRNFDGCFLSVDVGFSKLFHNDFHLLVTEPLSSCEAIGSHLAHLFYCEQWVLPNCSCFPLPFIPDSFLALSSSWWTICPNSSLQGGGADSVGSEIMKQNFWPELTRHQFMMPCKLYRQTFVLSLLLI